MISIEYFKGLPIEYESFLIEKYASYVTTCQYVEIYYPTYDFNYILINKDGKLDELLIFGNNGTSSKCFNLFAEIDQSIIAECMKRIFDEYPFIQKISIDASYKEYSFRKSILYSKGNDYIINLPPTMTDYYSELGHCTRKTIKKSKSKLLRDYPMANFVVKFGNEIDEDIINQIIHLNIDRMRHKGIIHGNNLNKNNIYKFSQHYGCVTYIEINGQIIAGTIGYILNKSLFGYLIGHNNDFSSYSAGKLSQLYEIQTCIEKGLLSLHFLWGDNEYKMRFLGKQYLLFSYQVYRTYSSDYFFSKIKTEIFQFMIAIRQSESMKPLRDRIKLFRSWIWKHKASLSTQQ